MSVDELKIWFKKYPQSGRKVIAICETCRKERKLRFCDYGDFCKSCSQTGINNGNHKNNIDIFINENFDKHFCQCGCGQKIIIKREYHRFGIPKYINGHNSKHNHPMKGRDRSGSNGPGWKGGNITLICNECGKEYETILSYKYISKFCSNNCHGKWQSKNKIGENNPNWKGGDIITICKYCNKEFKINLAQKDTRKFCSKKCHDKWRSENKTGENNPNWKGGISFDQYSKEFNRKLKYKIKNKYNNCDYISELNKNNKILDIHHIDYDKTNTNKENLIPLFKYNHGKTNGNRLFWKKLFKYSLEYDKEYYKNKNFNILKDRI